MANGHRSSLAHRGSVPGDVAMTMGGDRAGIRRARPEDAGAIAAVHVAAWREAYAGLVPAEALAALSVEARTAFWRRILGAPDPAVATAAFVACAPDGAVLGFGSCGRQRMAESSRRSTCSGPRSAAALGGP